MILCHWFMSLVIGRGYRFSGFFNEVMTGSTMSQRRKMWTNRPCRTEMKIRDRFSTLQRIYIQMSLTVVGCESFIDNGACLVNKLK